MPLREIKWMKSVQTYYKKEISKKQKNKTLPSGSLLKN